jgi:2-C-methyl-D-erythritol 4-phosphate cytidylyltransferase
MGNNTLGAIIVAAGKSDRMNGEDKILANLGDKTLLEWSVDICQSCDLIQEIVIVLDEMKLDKGNQLKRSKKWSKVLSICTGGLRRQDSVQSGLKYLTGCDWIMVHDGARPFLTNALIEQGFKTALKEQSAAIAAVPVKDTIKQTNDEGVIMKTLPRHQLWTVQTPQIFRTEQLQQAHAACDEDATDDSFLVELMGQKVNIFMGSYSNIKVTTREDLLFARAILQQGESLL